MNACVYSLRLVKDRSVRFPVRECHGSPQAAALIQRPIADAPSEHMVVVFLDAKNAVVGTTYAASGGQHGIQLAPRDIFRAAIAANAAAIILGHNHPSGDPRPSREDINTTVKLVEAGKLLGLPIVDHVIVAMDACSFSMADHETVQF